MNSAGRRQTTRPAAAIARSTHPTRRPRRTARQYWTPVAALRLAHRAALPVRLFAVRVVVRNAPSRRYRVVHSRQRRVFAGTERAGIRRRSPSRCRRSSIRCRRAATTPVVESGPAEILHGLAHPVRPPREVRSLEERRTRVRASVPVAAAVVGAVARADVHRAHGADATGVRPRFG